MGSSNRLLNLGDFTAAANGTAIKLDGKKIAGATLLVYGGGDGSIGLEVRADATAAWVPAVDQGGTDLTTIADGKSRIIGVDGAEVRAVDTGTTAGTLSARIMLLAG